MRALAPAVICSSLLLPLACGSEPNVPPGGMCPSIAWGGFNGTPDCAGIANSVISSEHRACGQDSDCAVVGANPCSAHAVNLAAADHYRAYPTPCNHPLAGMCAPVQWRAVCNQGCCQPSSM